VEETQQHSTSCPL